MKLIDEIKMSFTRSEGLFRLMFLNIVVFLLISVTKLIFFLAGSGSEHLTFFVSQVALHADFGWLLTHPWSLITYMFVHVNFLHILMNMLILFWSGKLFCEYLTSSRIVAVYLLGGIVGGLFYMISYNTFPVFSESVSLSSLIGASAGVLAVLVAIATLIPNYQMHLILFGPVKLKYIALVFTLIYLISIPDGNSGGNISHIGGIVFGFAYTRLLQKGINMGGWLEKMMSAVTGLFRPSSRIKVVHKSDRMRKASGTPHQELIDSILDKISRSGYSSLTKEEKEILFKASKTPEKDQ